MHCTFSLFALTAFTTLCAAIPAPSPEENCATTTASPPTSTTSSSAATSSTPAQYTYEITNAQISQWAGDLSPSTSSSDSSASTLESFDITVQGTNPGAQSVGCNVTWIASLACPDERPIMSQFTCSDPAVSAILERVTTSPIPGWYLIVLLDNKYPGMWRMKDMGSDPAWTLASNGSWIFNGQQVLGAVSSQPLADFIQA